MTDKARTCWRVGFQPQFSTEQLTGLLTALQSNSPDLVQGCSVESQENNRGLPGATCVVSYCLWKHGTARTVDQIHEAFSQAAYEANDLYQSEVDPQDQHGSRHFLCWYDEQPRAEVFAWLIAEIQLELDRRRICEEEEEVEEAEFFEGVKALL